VPAASQAGLVGSTVSVTPIFASGVAQPTLTAVVSDTTMEFSSIPSYYSLQLDIFDSKLVFSVDTVSTFPMGVFNGFQILFSDVTLTGVALDASSTMVPFAIGLTGNRLDVNYQGVTVGHGQQTIINIDSVAAAAVPEPESLALVGLALAALGLARRSPHPVKPALPAA